MTTKNLYEVDGSFKMNLREMIDWLTSLGQGQPCPLEEITFRVIQCGDPWDGYSECEIRVEREETPDEEAQRIAACKVQQERAKADQLARDRALYEELKRKFEASQLPPA